MDLLLKDDNEGSIANACLFVWYTTDLTGICAHGLLLHWIYKELKIPPPTPPHTKRLLLATAAHSVLLMCLYSVNLAYIVIRGPTGMEIIGFTGYCLLPLFFLDYYLDCISALYTVTVITQNRKQDVVKLGVIAGLFPIVTFGMFQPFQFLITVYACIFVLVVCLFAYRNVTVLDVSKKTAEARTTHLILINILKPKMMFLCVLASASIITAVVSMILLDGTGAAGNPAETDPTPPILVGLSAAVMLCLLLLVSSTGIKGYLVYRALSHRKTTISPIKLSSNSIAPISS